MTGIQIILIVIQVLSVIGLIVLLSDLIVTSKVLREQRRYINLLEEELKFYKTAMRNDNGPV